MPLNERSLLSQVDQHLTTFQHYEQEQVRELPLAIEQYRASTKANWLSLEELARAKQAAALPVEELDVRRPINEFALPEGKSYVVVATDGSVIPPDRHGGMDFCQVLNVGEVVLGYGERRMAHIEADTRLYFNGRALQPGTTQSGKNGGGGSGNKPNNLSDESGSEEGSDPDYEDVASSGNGGGGGQALMLDAEMSVAELEVALRLAGDYWATAALRDGPLTLWTSSILNTREGRALTSRYLSLIGKFGERGVPIVGYTSNTRSDVVMTALRTMSKRPYRGLIDAQLFGAVLNVGECSPAFRHSARHPKDAALTEQIRFMYLKTEYEVVRLEFSQEFLATPQLDTALAIVWHQIGLGQGYPAVLMEAHESAVLRQSDRDLLRAVLESYGLVGQESQKGLSKRLRSI